jgi:hydroxymethylpyrimidine pyrophosphatase-like HAD family hydrolase
MLVMVEPQDLIPTYNDLMERYGDKCYVTCSSRHFVELCNKNYSKGTAIAYLMNHFGVSKEESMAIGDQINDLPMLKSVGFGLAVKNCQEQLKKEVFVFDYTNEEDAVGRAIEKFAYID